jgi:hypothetical protein
MPRYLVFSLLVLPRPIGALLPWSPSWATTNNKRSEEVHDWQNSYAVIEALRTYLRVLPWRRELCRRRSGCSESRLGGGAWTGARRAPAASAAGAAASLPRAPPGSSSPSGAPPSPSSPPPPPPPPLSRWWVRFRRRNLLLTRVREAAPRLQKPMGPLGQEGPS